MQELKALLDESQVRIGSTLSILGTLEKYKKNMQVNIQKLRAIKDQNEEMFLYQYALKSQQAFFDPHKVYEKRIIHGQYVKEAPKSEDFDERNSAIRNEFPEQMNMQNDEVVKQNIKRIMKKFNDHIIMHYEQILFPEGTMEDNEDYGHKVRVDDITTNSELLARARE